MKHKYCELIKQWADGAKVQYLYFDGNINVWIDTNCPSWEPKFQFRIKPEPKYVPFTYETALANSLQKKAIRYKGSTEVVTILAFNTEYVFILDFTRPYKYLLEHYEFLDGSPCGILED